MHIYILFYYWLIMHSNILLHEWNKHIDIMYYFLHIKGVEVKTISTKYNQAHIKKYVH